MFNTMKILKWICLTIIKWFRASPRALALLTFLPIERTVATLRGSLSVGPIGLTAPALNSPSIAVTHSTSLMQLGIGSQVWGFCRVIGWLVCVGSGLNGYTQSDDTSTIVNTDSLDIYTLVPKVHALARHKDTVVWLRWSPSEPDIWFFGNIYGYVVSRATIGEKDNLEEEQYVILDTIYPREKFTWIKEAEIRENDRNFNAALEAIHGEWQGVGLGGDIFSAILRNDELQNRFAVCQLAAEFDFEVAKYSALGYIDHSVNPSDKYMYRISPAIPDTFYVDYSDAYVMADPNELSYTPDIYFEFQIGDQQLTLYWDRSFYEGFYSGYWIERKTGSTEFERVNDIPYLHGLSKDGALYTPYIIFKDEVPNDIEYTYRIVGIDPFGQEKISSFTSAQQAKDLSPPPKPELKRVDFLDDRNTVMQWTIEDSDDDLIGFLVHRGYDPDKPFYIVSDTINKSVRYFRDSTALNILPHYYFVSALKNNGKTSSSEVILAFMNDSLPPAKPLGLRGEADSTGLITLMWHPNSEIDILGYKVQFANDPNHEFSLITGEAIRDTIFQYKIALNSTTPYVYFRIFAVDLRFNYSQLSDIIRVARPDTLAPYQPVFYDYQVNQDTFKLWWHPSESNDVVSQRLYKSVDNISWELIQEFPIDVGYYEAMIDKSIFSAYFRMEAEDKSGLTSISPQDLYLVFPTQKLIEGITDFSLEAVEGLPVLTWNYRDASDVIFLLYRAVDDYRFEEYKLIKDGVLSYKDEVVYYGREFHYMMKVRSSSGLESIFCPMVTYTKPQTNE
jgi:hypothetical protein